jgi:metallo-beta-lactamase class B
MTKRSRQFGYLIAALIGGAVTSSGQSPDHPTITVYGKTWTPASVFARNMGTPEDQTTQFPPHKIVGNVYYVGTRTLSSFLIVTPEGNILMDTTFERNVRTIQKSVEQLGFKFADTKIILGNHAHNDHMEGDALAKELTGAQVVAMAEDAPALRALKPGGKEHPIDRLLHDGDTVTLGGTTLFAHLTPGHTRGCTTWTMKAKEGTESYDVVFHCSLRISGQNASKPVPPSILAEFNRTYPLVRTLPCDVPLGDHPGQYDMQEKFERLRPGAPNPFLDRAGCNVETDLEEAMFRAVVEEQAKAGKQEQEKAAN